MGAGSKSKVKTNIKKMPKPRTDRRDGRDKAGEAKNEEDKNELFPNKC